MTVKGTDKRIRLADETRKRIGQELIEKIRSAQAGMQDMLDMLADWDMFYEGRLPEKSFPWVDCSNICVPLTQWIVDTYKARIADVVLSVSPLVLVEPPSGLEGPEYKQTAQKVEGYLQGIVNRIGLCDLLADNILAAALRNPVAVTKLVWREELRLVQRFMPKTDETTGEIVDGGDGEPFMEAQEVEEYKYKGPKPEFVDVRNLVVYPLTAKNAEECEIIGDRFRLSKQRVKERVADGIWDTVVSSLPSESEAASESAAKFDDLNEYIGITALTEYDPMVFWEVIAEYDANGDGHAEDCVFTLEETTGTIVRAIRFPYFHGRRYYDLCVLLPRPGRIFGRTLPQIVEGMQREINAIHNQRVDAVSLSIAKSFLARTSSTVDPDTLVIYPGAVTLVDDPERDLKELNIDPHVPGIEVEQMARDYAERASGVGDIASGRETEERKTATEVGLVASEAGIRFADTIRAAQQTIVNMVEQIAGLCYQYGDEQELSAHQLERDDLIFPWRFIAHGNTGTANKAQQRQESQLLYNTLMQNPLVAGDLSRIWRLSQDMLQAFDRSETEAYLGTEDDARAMMAQMQAAQQAQQQGAMMGAQGGEVAG